MTRLLLSLAVLASVAGCATDGTSVGYSTGWGYPSHAYDAGYGYGPGAWFYNRPDWVGLAPVGPGPGARRGWGDRDRDGIPNRFDRDRDNDGIPNRMDRDRDGDGVPNRLDARPNNPRRH